MSAIPSAMQVMHLKNFYLQWLLSTQQEDKDVQPGVRKKKKHTQKHATCGFQKVARVCFIQVILRFLLIFFGLDKSHESIDEKQNIKREREFWHSSFSHEYIKVINLTFHLAGLLESGADHLWWFTEDPHFWQEKAGELQEIEGDYVRHTFWRADVHVACGFLLFQVRKSVQTIQSSKGDKGRGISWKMFFGSTATMYTYIYIYVIVYRHQ